MRRRAEVVVEVADVAESVADQLAAVDDAVFRKDELALSPASQNCSKAPPLACRAMYSDRR